ncbi:circadian associated repressor of transcription a isoform X2 [Hippocampus zosterae]|uniref:circadian associated repressor of transcription a isoform X2 n=1 Tax=Hippocampus zosterae TaxID=109293 RepID=UPI00223E7AF1|nr:circadian associated repressor of transcription a isoform X2 [Hippocampus zosterae]
MNPLGASSQWPAYNLRPSTLNYILSDSELTDDEGDILSEGEEDLGPGKVFSGYEGCFRGRLDKMYSRSKRAHHKVHVGGRAKYHLSPGAPAGASSSPSAGDLAFTQKCTDLHSFICPLMELLHGLKTGRFNKGLTSFQQSVAMDRLQRILGILQRPEMGERYLRNLLQIEGMLKLWFPQVAPRPTVTLAQSFTPKLMTPWRQNQLSMPVKKRKFTWSDSDCSETEPPKKKIPLPESCPTVTPCSLSSSTAGKQEAPKDAEGNWGHAFELANRTFSRLPQEHEISSTACTVAQDKSISTSDDVKSAKVCNDTTIWQSE